MKKTLIVLLILSSAVMARGQAPRLVVPVGHTDCVTSVAFSPDGKTALTGSWDNTAKLWDLSGREIQTFSGHSSYVLSVAFSPDGKTVLTGSRDNTAKLWDLSGREIQTFSGHSSYVFSVAFSPDGKTVLTGSDDKTAKLWDLSGREIQTFSGHRSEVRSVVFSPDGEKVLTGSRDNTAKLWDLSGREIQTFSGHSGYVFSVAFSPDGRTALTGSWDRTAKLWDLSGREIQTFSGHTSSIWSVAFSSEGRIVLTGGSDKTAKLWDLSGREIQTFSGHASDVRSMAFSPDGKTVLTGSEDKTAKLWDLSGREIRTFTGHASSILSVAFSPDGKIVLTGGEDKTAKLWDLSGQGIQVFSGHLSSVNSVTFSPDGKTVLTGSEDNTAVLWDLSGRRIKTFADHASSITSVAFSPDGKMILTGSIDKTAKLQDLSGIDIQSFRGHEYSVSSVAFSPDGKLVLTGSWDRSAKLWDLSGREIQTFSGHTSSVWSVTFSPDGEKVLTGSLDQTVKLWDLSGLEIQSFRGHTYRVSSVAFSPDGKTVLTGSKDNTTKLWHSTTGLELATLIAIDSIDWVVTTPSGLFDASPGAMRLMYYVVDLEVLELEQLKERYYEPGLLSKITGFSTNPPRSVEVFRTVPLYPKMMAHLSDDKLNLQVNLTPRNGGIGKLSLFVNGKEVTEDANPQRVSAVSIDLTEFAQYYLPNEPNKLTLRVYNEAGWLKSSALEIEYQPPATARGGGTGGTTSFSLNKKPSLYAVVVGTAEYAGDKLDLKFADFDAAYFSSALRAAAPKVFGERVYVTLLSTDAEEKSRQDVSGKATIKKAFADVAAKAQAQDVLVIYFSGHGVNYGAAESGQFYYLTKDIASENLTDPEIRNNYAISSSELTEWIKAIPALKQVMIIDACNSGKIVEYLAAGSKDLNSSQVRALDRMKDRTGMFILTGSAADKVSYEAGQYGQGLLTYSLLQGMSGLALTEDKRVDVMTLFQYSRDKVPDLAKGIGGVQTPVLAFPISGASFDIGIVDASVKIPVAQVKPVFIRNVFQDDNTFDDGLGLTQALADYFLRLTVKGAQAELIYVDVSEYENAYSIKGRYTVNGDEVTVRARLFKGKTTVGAELTVTGMKDDVQGMVEGIMAKVQGMLK